MDGEAIEARARALLADCVRRKRPNIAHRIETDSPLSYLPISAGDYFSAIVAALTPKPSAEMRESVARIMFDIGSQRLGIGDDPWESAGASVQDEYLKDADAILSSLPIVAEREVIERETIERCAGVLQAKSDEFRALGNMSGLMMAKIFEEQVSAIRSLTPTEKRDVE